ncbi:MAG: recombination regulator RecX [Gammaproteobacteria bacterium]|nr:recombination regulator RecX [Gammaproteobacteria bacterium]
MPKKHNSKQKPDTAYERAVQLLARREHSQKELERKLLLKDFCIEDITPAIKRLADRGWQSDTRFTESWIRHRTQSGHGPQRIQQELAEKGVERSIVELAFDKCEVDWFERAKDVWFKKYNEVPDSWPEKAKQIRFLMYRGFNMDHINFVFEQVK